MYSSFPGGSGAGVRSKGTNIVRQPVDDMFPGGFSCVLLSF